MDAIQEVPVTPWELHSPKEPVVVFREQAEGKLQQAVDDLVRQVRRARIKKEDLDRYGYTEGCPRCMNTQVGDTISTSNHWESCRRKIYRLMYMADDPKLHRWLRDHPADDTKVGTSLLEETGGASSSTAPPPAAAGSTEAPKPPIPPPSSPPGGLHAFEGVNEDDFSTVVTMLVEHGVEPIEAQRFVTALVKGTSANGDATGCFELYGQWGPNKGCQEVQGVECAGIGSARPANS